MLFTNQTLASISAPSTGCYSDQANKHLWKHYLQARPWVFAYWFRFGFSIGLIEDSMGVCKCLSSKLLTVISGFIPIDENCSSRILQWKIRTIATQWTGFRLSLLILLVRVSHQSLHIVNKSLSRPRRSFHPLFYPFSLSFRSRRSRSDCIIRSLGQLLLPHICPVRIFYKFTMVASY